MHLAYKSVFRRYEIKYLLTYEQKKRVLETIDPYMALDSYGRTAVRNLYLDTDDYRLIRRSIEKPDYKEKLRVRSYCQADATDTVFVELKKKYDGVVYKRRIGLAEAEAMDWVLGRRQCPRQCQISREIDYFKQYYGPLRPSVFLSYEREAYCERNGGDFRITFDDNLLARSEDVSLLSPVYGTPIMQEDRVLMEIKCSGAIPLWLVGMLSKERIYKTSFSKYGRAYTDIILTEQQNRQKELLKNAFRTF